MSEINTEQQQEQKPKKKFNWKALVGGLVVLVVILAIYFGCVGYQIAKNGNSGKSWSNGSLFFLKEVMLNNFLGVNAILIGLLVCLGYIILGRGFTGTILGTIKAIIGVLLLQIGSGALIGLAKPVFIGISKLGGTVTPLDTYLGMTSASAWLDSIGAGFSAWVSYAMVIGLFVNIILIALRKWTNVHSLMITGHVMFQQACVVVPVSLLMMFGQLRDGSGAISVGGQLGTIFFSGILLGIYWGVASSSTIKGSDVVTQNAGFAVGHQQMFGIAIAYSIGKYFGKKEESAENRKMPAKAKVFEDNIFTQSLLVLAVFLVLILILQYVPTKNTALRFADSQGHISGSYGAWKVGGGNVYWAVNLILGSLQVVAAILAIQTGVRMFVAELQQSFQGISEKLVPGAVVAVDVAATYGFSPNSVTFGFISGTIAQFAAAGLIIGLAQIPGNFKITMVIPLFITLFFNSGSIGVFANASGGYKAAIAVPAIFGFLEIIAVSLGLSMINNFGPAAFGGISDEFTKLQSAAVKEAQAAVKAATEAVKSSTAALAEASNALATATAANKAQLLEAANKAQAALASAKAALESANTALDAAKNTKEAAAAGGVFLNASNALSNYLNAIVGSAKSLGVKPDNVALKAFNDNLGAFQKTIDGFVKANAKFSAAGVDAGPFATGYNGMFDWTFIWGLLMILGGWNKWAAVVVFTLYPIVMLILAQIIDSNRQHKPTLLQKAFKIKPNLVEEAKAEEAQSQPTAA